MTNETAFLPVNWTDGMKINKKHFIADQNFYLQQIALAAGSGLNSINYGLLPPVDRQQSPFKIFADLDNQGMIHVRLLNCRAILPGGISIDVQAAQHGSSEYSVSTPREQLANRHDPDQLAAYMVVLTVNPFDRQPVGDADPLETPPRLPFTQASFILSLLPATEFEGQKPGRFQLTLAKLFVDQKTVRLDEQYIPPCTSTASHPDLVEVFYGLEEFMGRMELYCLQIIQKIRQKKQANELAAMVEELCHNVLSFQQSNFSRFRWLGMHAIPAEMLSLMGSFSRVVRNTLDLYANNGKEELVNYFVEWCDINQGEFESMLVNLSNYRYTHENINEAVTTISGCTTQLASLFAKLSRLDYIGKKKDANIFVKEEIVNPEINDYSARKRRSFLAD
jgi:hypothetical protein